jgi:hypothetical protein
MMRAPELTTPLAAFAQPGELCVEREREKGDEDLLASSA